MIRNKIIKSIKIAGKPWTCHDDFVRTMMLKNINEKRTKRIKTIVIQDLKFQNILTVVKMNVPVN